MINEHDFTIRLLEVFRVEAQGHRQAMLSALRELEKGEADAEYEANALERSFRAAHTLKGAARAVNNGEVADLCQTLESIFSLVKNGRGRLTQKMFGSFYEAIETIEKMEAGSGDSDSTLNSRLNDIRGALDG